MWVAEVHILVGILMALILTLAYELVNLRWSRRNDLLGREQICLIFKSEWIEDQANKQTETPSFATSIIQVIESENLPVHNWVKCSLSICVPDSGLGGRILEC